MTDDVIIRAADSGEHGILVRHFVAMWRDIGLGEADLLPDAPDLTASFIAAATRDACYRGFLALEGGRVIGSAGAQLFAGLYPMVFAPRNRKMGYVWGVYVEADCRGRGVATRLTEAAVAYLRTLGCSQVRLHAAPQARSVYERMGFAPTNEMRLEL